MTTGPDKPLPLRSWLWKSYIRAALVPLLLIELTFVGLYWGTSLVVYNRGAEAVTKLSTGALSDTAQREADVIARRLEKISAEATIFADETARALTGTGDTSPEEKARYATSPEGAFYTVRDNGGAAVFYSGVVPVGEAEKQKVWRTASLDPLMRSITRTDHLIQQVYFNTFDSYNRIYPYFDVLEIYPPKMDIPSYNFYYEADATHNPARKVVWTDSYVDPAGSGWMVSAIAPSYGPDRLEAVIGIDITISTIVEQVLDLDLQGDSYALLVSRDGTILALPPKGEADFGLSELLDHSYEEAIKEDTFKPGEFNIFRRAEFANIADALQDTPDGTEELDLGRPMIAAWSTIDGPGWKLVVLSSEKSILSEATSLREQLSLVSKLMLGGLVLFYLLFFAFLWKRSNAMSERVAQPLAEIEANMVRISEGGRIPPTHAYEVAELQTVGDHLVNMGAKLDAANRAKANFLSAMSHELRTPLNAIIGFSDLLEMSQGETLDAERMKQVKAISRAGWHLLQLVEGVIDLSRIEQDEVKLSSTPLEVMPILDAARQTALAAAAERNITITLNRSAAVVPPVKGDPDVLRRIVGHLLSNAVKYNRDGGSITLSVGTADPSVIAVSVTDTGTGIAAALQSRVFTPFDRLGHENSTINGTGIGLAICKRLAELTGCTLTFTSESDVGSTFTLRIPRA
ncbi:sensor histidine kinase [Paragemmobacter straminiformis]|uniref:histidine kinase n=1 Tax=Paragemmobacter straminiformis TaxID=2045119 RepID=A0A842I6M0_9RHOB|nr:sensor histidine kinase [Gemmobacter straminiformis]MBC2835722.1 sensor histidine kinase [Gemmobacter straminiformis]